MHIPPPIPHPALRVPLSFRRGDGGEDFRGYRHSRPSPGKARSAATRGYANGFPAGNGGNTMNNEQRKNGEQPFPVIRNCLPRQQKRTLART
jgi:hypothetical protein